MKKQEKRMILILLAVLAIVIIALVINKNAKKENKENKAETANNTVTEEFVQVLEDGTKLNTSEQLNKTKQVGAYKFENMQLTEQGSQTVLLADVTNTSSSATNMQLLDVTLLDKNGKEIVTIGGIISPLQPGAKTQFNTSMTLDYANTYDFKITLK
jgi:preprotein translocase subunit YajC